MNSDRKILTTLRHSKREMIMELTRNIHMAISRDKKKQNQYFWTAYSVFTMPKEWEDELSAKVYGEIMKAVGPNMKKQSGQVPRHLERVRNAERAAGEVTKSRWRIKWGLKPLSWESLKFSQTWNMCKWILVRTFNSLLKGMCQYVMCCSILR